MTTISSEPATTGVPATSSLEGVIGDDQAMRAWAEALVARARQEGVELTGDDGLLTALVRRVLQTGLEVEMTDHLGYERHAVEGRGSGNSRNGATPDGHHRDRQGGAAGSPGSQRPFRAGQRGQGAAPLGGTADPE